MAQNGYQWPCIYISQDMDAVASQSMCQLKKGAVAMKHCELATHTNWKLNKKATDCWTQEVCLQNAQHARHRGEEASMLAQCWVHGAHYVCPGHTGSCRRQNEGGLMQAHIVCFIVFLTHGSQCMKLMHLPTVVSNKYHHKENLPQF